MFIYLFIYRMKNAIEPNFSESNGMMMSQRAIKIEDEESSFGFDCIICHELFATRSERNDHLESHFIRKNCEDCNRSVIVIGDIEFELHRPLHCQAPYVNRISIVNVETLAFAQEKSNIEQPDDGIFLKETTTNFNDEGNNVPVLECTTEMAILPDDLAANIVANKSESAKTKKRQQTRTVKVKTPPKKIDEKSNVDNKNVKKFSRLSKPIQCTQDGCNKEFRQQRSFRMHLKNQHGIVERVHCPICNFGFSDKINLKNHMILHGDHKRFICSFCGTGFHKLANMNEHMNAHLGLKPYTCDICFKQFGRDNHRRQHQRVHSGLKPYKCEIKDDTMEPCTKAYMFKIDLKRHQRSVHGIIEKTFPCPIPNCSKIFYENKYLTKHKTTAHN